MLKYFVLCSILVQIINGNLEPFPGKRPVRLATLKPMSICCNIPEIGEIGPLTECSSSKLHGPCNELQCVFEKSGFLTDPQTLNKEAYTSRLRQWSEEHSGWNDAVEKVIQDCVNKDVRQHLDEPCKAYDIFACTGIAMIKKCPTSSWVCNS